MTDTLGLSSCVMWVLLPDFGPVKDSPVGPAFQASAVSPPGLFLCLSGVHGDPWSLLSLEGSSYLHWRYLGCLSLWVVGLEPRTLPNYGPPSPTPFLVVTQIPGLTCRLGGQHEDGLLL